MFLRNTMNSLSKCCSGIRSSETLVIVVICIAMFTDSLLLTLVDPILPKMLERINNMNRPKFTLEAENMTLTFNEKNTGNHNTDTTFILVNKTFHLNILRNLNEITQDIDNWDFNSFVENDGTTDDFSVKISYPLSRENITEAQQNDVTLSKNLSAMYRLYAINNLNNGGKFGYLVAAKGAAQFICNPFVGHIISRYGYRGPMLFGSFLLIGSTLAFGYSISYWMLMICRLFQGLASSLTAVTSLGLAADTFRDDTRRGRVVGYAFGGLSLGIIVGPIYGSVLYDFVSPEFPFQLLSGVILLSVAIQIFSFKRTSITKKESPAAIFHLVKDPYILIVAANIFLLNLDTSIVLAFLPLELLRLTNASTWKLGIVVLPTSIGYLIAGVVCPRIIHFVPRWLQGLCGMFISAGTLMALAYCYTFVHMIIVTTFLGLAIGTISTSMQPIFAYLVDIRHSEVYGNVYAISDMAVCLAMFLGPLVGGPVLYAFNFQSLLFGAAVLDLLVAPLCYLLKDPKKNYKSSPSEKKALLRDSENNQITYSYNGHLEH